MIKLRDLQYLDAIEQYRHFGKAAEACYVSQPTLSGQIMKLEDSLGLQLVERDRRNVMLTPAGEELVKQARIVLNAANQFEDTAKALLDPLAGDLHIGLIPTLAPYLLPHIMSTLGQALPNIRFYLYENQTRVLLEQLSTGKLDMLILPWLDTMARFERYDLFAEPLLLTTAPDHPLAGKPSLDLDDLSNQQLLTLEDGHCLREQALGYCFAAGADEDKRFQATSLETLRYMVGSGLGITMLPKLATLTATSETFRYIPFNDPIPVRQIALVIRPNYSRMACVREIVANIREVIKPILQH